jgi:hypothetical protein
MIPMNAGDIAMCFAKFFDMATSEDLRGHATLDCLVWNLSLTLFRPIFPWPCLARNANLTECGSGKGC